LEMDRCRAAMWSDRRVGDRSFGSVPDPTERRDRGGLPRHHARRKNHSATATTRTMSAIVKMTPISDSFRRMEVAYPGVGLLNRGRTGGG